MELQSAVSEYNNSCIEEKRLRGLLKTVAIRKKVLEKSFEDFLKKRSLVDVTVNNTYISKKVVNKTNKILDKSKNITDVLAKYDISGKTEIAREILESMKGERKQVEKLRVKVM